MRKIKLWEMLIILAILITSLFLFFIIRHFQSNGNIAVITINSETVGRIDLETAENMKFQIENITIEIKDSRIKVLNSDCPDKICMHKGYISHSGESIVCMPNKFIIEIKENHE